MFGGDLRGFAFEYMTGGRAVVLGDPGRWICSGMSGGMVFLRARPDLNDRIAKGAKVGLREVGPEEEPHLRDLLEGYAARLEASGQTAAAGEARALLADRANFRVIRPAGDLVDQTISTE